MIIDYDQQSVCMSGNQMYFTYKANNFFPLFFLFITPVIPIVIF